MKKELPGILLFLMLLLIVNSLLLFIYLKNPTQNIPNNIEEVCFTSSCFEVEVVKNKSEREKGLMFRDILEENKGMLFIFEKEDLYNFWMKDTLIPLDIIWIDKNLEVNSIFENATPCLENTCPVYNPKIKALYVLEVNSGIVKNKNITVGEKVSFN